MNDEPQHRMAPGLGVIEWQGRILVYQMTGNVIAWARFLGEQTAEITADLQTAIDADRARASVSI